MSNSSNARRDARGAEVIDGCWPVPASIMALIRDTYPKDGYALAVCFGYLLHLAAEESPGKPYGASFVATARGVGAAIGCEPRVARDLLVRLDELGVLHEPDRDRRRAKANRGNRVFWLSRAEDALIAKRGVPADPQRRFLDGDGERGTVCAHGSASIESDEAAEYSADAEPTAHTVPFGGKGVIARAPESSFSSETESAGTKDQAGVACEPVAQQREQEAKRARSKPVTIDDVDVPAELNTPEGRAAIVDWLEFKRAKRQSYKRACDFELLLRRFAPYGPDVMAAAIETARGQNWNSISPDMVKRVAKSKTNPGAFTYDPNTQTDLC